MPFKVMVDDNYHYMDESERYEHGEFRTLSEAIAASRRIVDEYLLSVFQPGMPTDQLLTSYLMFGEDPFIVSTDPAHHGVLFSARDYARERCQAICEPTPREPGIRE